MHDAATALNESLAGIYGRYRSRMIEVRGDDFAPISPPCLVKVSPVWSTGDRRIAVVGQETRWHSFKEVDATIPDYKTRWTFGPMMTMKDFLDHEDGIHAMMTGYELFSFSEHQKSTRASTFWRWYRDVRNIVGDEVRGFDTRVLTTNLWRQDYNGGPVWKAPKDLRERLAFANENVLLEELGALAPTDVTFITGPDYDIDIMRQFPGARFEPAVAGVDMRKIARVIHPDLPERTMRTYHPRQINIQKIWDTALGVVKHAA